MWVRVLIPLIATLTICLWLGEADCQDSGCGTPKQQTGSQGTISSMNYPSNYNHKARCTWIIRVNTRYRIRLHFTSPFKLFSWSYQSLTVCFDWVSLYKDVSQTQLIGQYCKALPADIFTESNLAVVVFKLDYLNEGGGFRLQWTAVERHVSGCGTPYSLFNLTGSITSMNYPQQYRNNADCQWTISVDSGMRVRLEFDEDFNIEAGPQHSCDFDFVEVSRVNGKDLGGSYGKFCGSTAPSNPILSDDNDIAVSFRSDVASTYTGFKLRWTAIHACGEPDAPTNGTVSLSDLDRVNSKATYTCDEGFRLVGINRRCLQKGRWTGDTPKCQEIRCGRPEEPFYSSVSLSDSDRIGSTVMYSCNTGFKLIGKKERRCLDSGSWSDDAPKCQGQSIHGWNEGR